MDAQQMNGRHSLSQLAGNYREWAPNVALRDHVRCLWVNDLSLSSTKSICVVPDGCVDIIWTRDGLRIAGPDTRASLEQLAPQSLVVGIRFHPGAASAWLGVPLSEILNARVPLAEFWGGESERLFDRASECGETKLVAAVLEGALMTRLSKVGQPDPGIGLLRQAAGHDAMRCQRVDALAFIDDGAAVGADQARDGAQRRALAGAVAADQRHDAALLHAQVNAVQRANGAVAHLEARYF